MNNTEWEKFISGRLKEAGIKIDPPRGLLAKIIAAESGRCKDKQLHFNFFSAPKFFISASAAMLLLAVALSWPSISSQANKSSSVFTAKFLADKTEINNKQPLSTDDVDDAVNAIVASVSDEDSAIKDQVDNEYLPDEDSAAIKKIIQNYDQDKF
jgi:hypothetical protein